MGGKDHINHKSYCLDSKYSKNRKRLEAYEHQEVSISVSAERGGKSSTAARCLCRNTELSEWWLCGLYGVLQMYWDWYLPKQPIPFFTTNWPLYRFHSLILELYGIKYRPFFKKNIFNPVACHTTPFLRDWSLLQSTGRPRPPAPATICNWLSYIF